MNAINLHQVILAILLAVKVRSREEIFLLAWFNRRVVYKIRMKLDFSNQLYRKENIFYYIIKTIMIVFYLKKNLNTMKPHKNDVVVDKEISIKLILLSRIWTIQ